ncbi:gbsA [Symbiodinium sp. CCMP2592]|nr:gbsA [Symbiodinium sp. CCMP2592]
MLIAAKKIAVALAAGNSVVVKPPVEAPLTVLRLAELLQESGLPPGVLQVVPGEGPEAGGALARHERVERVDFTGGTETGLLIQRTMAEAGRVRAYCAELGGNAPILVFSDTRSVQEAVDGVAFAAFVASGQTCVSGKRILVQNEIFEEFKERLVQKAEQLRLGDPLKTETEIGPVISKKQLERIESQVERAIVAGARALTGGKRPPRDRCELADTGHFFEPTVLSEVSPSNPAFAEEIFGPVVSLSNFEAEEDALALANASQYGLGGAIWTEDVRKSLRVARKLRCGLSWVNCHHRNDPSSPWGGFGQSGIGRENGPEAFEEYTTTQSLTIRNSDTAENWFGGASVSELIYQQLLAKKEHSGIDAWYQEYVSEAWQKRNNLQKTDIERQAKSCGENTPMWVEALSAGMELAAEVFEEKAERLRSEVARDVVLELLESLSPKLCISHYARCGLGQIGIRAVVGVLWHFDADAEVAGLCADSLRWAIAGNEQNRNILLDLHIPTSPSEAKGSLSFSRVAMGAFLFQAGGKRCREEALTTRSDTQPLHSRYHHHDIKPPQPRELPCNGSRRELSSFFSYPGIPSFRSQRPQEKQPFTPAPHFVAFGAPHPGADLLDALGSIPERTVQTCRQGAAATEAVFAPSPASKRVGGSRQVLQDPAVAVKLAACLLAAGDAGSLDSALCRCAFGTARTTVPDTWFPPVDVLSHEYACSSSQRLHGATGGVDQVAADWGA